MNRLFFLISVSLLFSCKQKAPKSFPQSFDAGRMENGQYINDLFKLSIDVPNGWYFMDEKGRTQITSQNIERYTENYNDPEEVLQEATKQVTNIFTLFKFPPDTTLSVNPNITMVATNIVETPDLKDVDLTMSLAMENMQQYAPHFKLLSDFSERSFGERTFNFCQAEMLVSEVNTFYDFYISNFDQYNLNMTISYSDETEKEELYAILNQLKFE